ncbi:STAS/SEC14 domain-containing protein [Microbaculum marinum]|uniref:STAS/SEC14 domain-containing protein n=1 Tax=Microbaculum marinum TaxID=1764581 RepID=A0AAW9RRE9_9HYPH
MLTPIWGLPENVIGFEASGRVSNSDYKERLIPALEKAIAESGPVRFLYVLGDGFDGYDPTAMWDDTLFGLKHIKDFRKVAVVTDDSLYAGATRMFAPMMPCEVKVFPLSERDAAKAWVAE